MHPLTYYLSSKWKRMSLWTFCICGNSRKMKPAVRCHLNTLKTLSRDWLQIWKQQSSDSGNWIWGKLKYHNWKRNKKGHQKEERGGQTCAMIGEGVNVEYDLWTPSSIFLSECFKRQVFDTLIQKQAYQNMCPLNLCIT